MKYRFYFRQTDVSTEVSESQVGLVNVTPERWVTKHISPWIRTER